MSQHGKAAAALLAIALLHAGCGAPEQDTSSGATGGGSTSVSSASSASGATNGASSSDASSASTGQPPVNPGEVDCRTPGDGKSTLAFVNKCDKPLQFLGSLIEGGELGPGQFACRDVGTSEEPLSSLRYWAYAGSDPGGGRHTLAEMTLNTDFNDFDWYNISHVDAFNLPIQIVPLARPKCDVLTCAADWLEACPSAGQYQDSQGAVVACVSPERDNPDSPVARFFEACDDGYAWSGDDQNGTDPSPVRACAGEDWKIVFCPQAEP